MKNFFLLVLMVFLGVYSYAAKTVDWKTCQDPFRLNSTLPFNSSGEFRADCAPDTLYSWREDESLNPMVSNQKRGVGPVEGHPSHRLYLSKTPLSSHGYGKTGVRVKLRKGVKFIDGNKEGSGYEYEAERDCSYYSEKYGEEIKNIVIVSSLGRYRNFSEYILCDDGPIESWSYGTPEHLKEEEKEFAYYQRNPKAGDHENAHPNATMVVKRCYDRKDCSLNALNARLDLHRKRAKEGSGEIFYMPGTPSDRAKHFAVTKEFYYSLTEKEREEFNTELTSRKSAPKQKGYFKGVN